MVQWIRMYRQFVVRVCLTIPFGLRMRCNEQQQWTYASGGSVCNDPCGAIPLRPLKLSPTAPRISGNKVRQYDKDKAREVFAATRRTFANHEEVYQALRITYLVEIRYMLKELTSHECNLEMFNIEGTCRNEDMDLGCTKTWKVAVWSVRIDKDNRLIMNCIDFRKMKPTGFNEDDLLEIDFLLCEADTMLLREICTAMEELKEGVSLWPSKKAKERLSRI